MAAWSDLVKQLIWTTVKLLTTLIIASVRKIYATAAINTLCQRTTKTMKSWKAVDRQQFQQLLLTITLKRKQPVIPQFCNRFL